MGKRQVGMDEWSAHWIDRYLWHTKRGTHIPISEIFEKAGYQGSNTGFRNYQKRGFNICAALAGRDPDALADELGVTDERVRAQLKWLVTRVGDFLLQRPSLPPPPLTSRTALREALLDGEAGLDALARGKYPQAYALLTNSIDSLHLGPASVGTSNFEQMLDIARAQLHLQTGYRAEPGPAARYTRPLELAERYEGGNPRLDCLISRLGRGVASALRLSGRCATPPILKVAVEARLRLESCGVKPGKEPGVLEDLVGLRDEEAKLGIRISEGWMGEAPRWDWRDQIIAGLDQVVALAGAYLDTEEGRHAWLWAAFTRIECLGIMGRYNDALRCWDEVMERDWVGPFIAQRPIPFVAKQGFAKLCIVYARFNKADLQEVEQAADKLGRQIANLFATSETLRLRAVALAAKEGEHGALLQAFL